MHLPSSNSLLTSLVGVPEHVPLSANADASYLDVRFHYFDISITQLIFVD
jgi:hypothetical protein